MDKSKWLAHYYITYHYWADDDEYGHTNTAVGTQPGDSRPTLGHLIGPTLSQFPAVYHPSLVSREVAGKRQRQAAEASHGAELGPRSKASYTKAGLHGGRPVVWTEAELPRRPARGRGSPPAQRSAPLERTRHHGGVPPPL